MKIKKLVLIFAFFLPGIFWISPASAHTSLISEIPVGNSIIETLPTEVSLTFDETLIVIGNSNVITVLDPNGIEITNGETKVSNNVVSRSLGESDLSGNYSVTYRVVSEDGHVVSATYQFALKNNSSSQAPQAKTAPTISPSETPVSVTNKVEEIHKVNDLHSGHSFWGRHAGHFYIFLAALFLIFAWKKQAK